MIRDYFAMAWTSIQHRKVRSYLTMIGIFIGIAAVVSLIALGAGLNTAIAEQLSTLGGDKLFISPKAAFQGMQSSSSGLTDEDIDVVEGVRGIIEAAPEQYKAGRIEFGREQVFNYIINMPDEQDDRDLLSAAFQVVPIKGRVLERGENYKAMIGSGYLLKNVFSKPVQVGQTITVNDLDFEVVGIIQTSEANSGTDNYIFINTDAYKRLYGENVTVDMIMAQVGPGEDVGRVSNDIERALRSSRNLKEGNEDFEVQTPLQLVSSFTAIFNIVQVVLVGIAAISLLVGAIGIMNTMYTSVTERTKEIGIMKSIGATNENILLLFLIESGMLGLFGGAIGVALGFLIGKGVQAAGSAALGSTLIRAEYSLGLIVGALAFSFVLGAISGVIPARQASMMKPVDALRFK